jgi:hypothetical protein
MRTALAALLATSSLAFAQGDPASPPARRANQTLPPPIRLGQRVIALNDASRVIPRVVIVKDARSYLGAISAWTPTVRFPVFIDDGSPAAAEDIARFVRAFKPEKVVAWQAPEAEGGAKDSPPFVPVDRPRVAGALNESWDLPPGTPAPDFIASLQKAGHTPPGVVVLNSNDPAWTGGLALAAAHGQPVVWVEALSAIDHFFTVPEADDYCAKVETKVAALPLSWRALGDDIDAVTLATNTPAKLDKGGHDFLAMTDRVGRLGTGSEAPQRWAWAGQVHGSARESASRAMCAIFMTHTSAWFFDGYPEGPPWSAYDCTKAAKNLEEQLSLKTEVLDAPRQGAGDWRARAARPVDADVLLITTKGNADFFDLTPGQCKPGDVPILARPGAVHIVHSWSALFPGSRDLLAGRWMERGAYFYVGSVHEPYLNAFLPTPMLAARMFSGAAWGAAVRVDGGPCWKVAVFGDPLTVNTTSRVTTDAPLPLEGATDIDAMLRDDLRAAKFEDAFRALVLVGRDADLAKVASALLKDDAKRTTISPAAAELAILPLFRTKQHDDLASMYPLMDRTRSANPALRDALWLAAYPRMAAPGEAWLNALKVNLRKDQIARDATAVAAAIARTKNKEAADEFLRTTRGNQTDKSLQDALDTALKLPQSEWGK